MIDQSTTDQLGPFTQDELGHHRAIRFALGDGGWRAYCHGKSLEFLLPRQPHPRRSMARDRAAQFARWASGEEWRPGRGDNAPSRVGDAWNAKDVTAGPPREPRKVCTQLADPAEPAACIECGNGECEDIASGYCCKCYADEYGGNTWCHHCAGLLPEAPSVAETPPQVADILGRPVTISTRSKGCCASVTLEGGTVHMYWGESAEDAWGLLARSLGCDE